MRKLEIHELGRTDAEGFKRQNKIPVVVVLDNIRSMNNVGSVFRTCDAFVVEKLILCGITARPPHREIHKTALGAEDVVEWQYIENVEDALASLKETHTVVAVEQCDEKKILGASEIKAPLALVFGNEAKGVSDEAIAACDYALEIPQYGTKHSLNISVSVGVVLWEFIRKGIN